MALHPVSNSSKEVERVVEGASNHSTTVTEVACSVLVEAPAVNSTREVGRSFAAAEGPSQALFQAICMQAIDIKRIEALLAAGANPNAVDRNGTPPLVYAVCRGRYGSLDIVKVLLKNGADPNIEYGDRQSALTSAIAREHLGTIEALIAAGAKEVSFDQTKIDQDLLDNSYFQNDDIKARIALIRGANPNFKGFDGQTALTRAVQGFNEQHVARLLGQGADCSITDDEGSTALMYAAGRGKPNPKVLRLLLRHGKKIDAVDKAGYTALMRAARVCNFEAVKLLLAAGADPDIQNQHGHNALYIVTNYYSPYDSRREMLPEMITLLQRAMVMQDEGERERQAAELLATLEAIGWI